MSKSFDWAMQRIKTHSSLVDRTWAKAEEVKNTEKLFRDCLRYSTPFEIKYFIEENNISYSVRILFNPETEYDYNATYSSCHDGTLLFITQGFRDVIQRISNADTYFIPAGPPENGDKITYTVGNFVLLNEYGYFGDKKQPWLKTRTTLLLPIKYEKEREYYA